MECKRHLQKLQKAKSKSSLNLLKKPDHILEYSKSLTARGLGHMARRDAERENNGPQMLMYWKADMIDFWKNNHYKYLLLGHRLLCGMSVYMMMHHHCIQNVYLAAIPHVVKTLQINME